MFRFPLVLLAVLAGGCQYDGVTRAEASQVQAAVPVVASAERSPGGIAFEDSVHALVVFVRFADDREPAPEWPIVGTTGEERLPPWGAGLIRETPEEVSALGLDDPSLSAYFYHQSKNGPAGPHLLTGEVWPRDRSGVAHVWTPPAPSPHYSGAEGVGYGFLTRDLLAELAGSLGPDLGRFDANRDGELDHLMLIVRRDPGAPLTGGVASLSGVTNDRVRTGGRPSATLVVGQGADALRVDLDAFGSGAISWIGGEYAFRTLAHEYGHILFDMGHTVMITPPDVRSPLGVSNDVPFDVPARGGGAFACQYNRMCGGGARSNGTPYESSNYDGTVTLSGYELRRMGWAARTVLDPARDTAGVTLAPLYNSGQVGLIPLRAGSGADTLSLENRQRTNYFDAFPPWDLADPFYGLVYRDLPTTGLLATLTVGSPTGPASRYGYDYAPPSNALVRSGTRCDGTSPGCWAPYGLSRGDMMGPGSARQMTPWTRPNVSGYTVYPAGFEPNWFAVTDIRQAPADALAFDLVADFRTAPQIRLTADSWMGAETSGTVFASPVTVASGAALCVWQGAAVTFGAGLAVEPGARFVCAQGATCRVGGARPRTIPASPGVTCAPQRTG